ncbi:MAG: toprim domain-containing protein [Alphaproteobacteria bacterium]|jgi:putative DNA primase/helicase|nr:toprim domain-containing protein [Alphaproteobacteria bacterium]PZQ42310.1 MAG: hypothetical protein DI570_29820 [Phenylobacterium zucineum]MBU2040857.1 toprim domain-containing protein [Alphaproteobacteria bacterium]MBU2127323.1 toprim domain-containing protein [Alphaproteobacteria bacterium]MBU2207719.1 toprim domain-containing protein [Alphaproteobacteria bacterium]
MTLHRLVVALGGDLYAGGFRANVPAPGHSAQDRSVSLLLTQGRVVVHGFGGADWRIVRDWLQDQGFIDAEGRLTGQGQGASAVARPDSGLRQSTAAGLWEGGLALGTGTVARRHLALRAVSEMTDSPNLRHHPNAPTSVYQPGRHARPALMARISDDADRLTAVELTYLDPNGRRTTGLRLSRKTVGHVPVGAAVRLAPCARDMLVGEGVVTTLSAMDRFGLPGWALRSANNLAGWTPPEGVRDVLIAADNGTVGLGAAARLEARLVRAGLVARVQGPDLRFADWSEAAMAAAGSGREEQGR